MNLFFSRPLFQWTGFTLLAMALTGCANLEKSTETSLPLEPEVAAASSSAPSTAPDPVVVRRATRPPTKLDPNTEPPADIWLRIRQGVAMQRRQGVHGFEHLSRSTRKNSAAPTRKQGVATKQNGVLFMGL